MATDFTQDSVLHFIQSSGGSVKNSDLLLHFRGFIRDHADQDRNRELFKKFINSVATVQQLDGVKHVVLRKKFRGHVPGSGGEGGSSGPSRLPAGRSSEPSAESARLSAAGRAEKPRQKATTPAPPGEAAGKTILLPAAGLIMLNNNNNNVETNLNLQQKQQQVASTPEVLSRPAAVQVVGQAPEKTEVKISSMSELPAQHQQPKAGPQHRMGHGPPPGVPPVVSAIRHHGGPSQQVPDLQRGVQVVGQVPEKTEVKISSMSEPPAQHQHPKAGPQHRMGHGPPPGVTPVVSAVRHHGGPSQQVPEPLRGLQPQGGLLHQEPPLHEVGPHPQAAAHRRHRYRPSYKSAVSYDNDDEEEEEEVPMGRGSAGGAWPVSVPLGDAQRAISTSSPCIIDPPAPPAVVSSSLTEVKLPEICIQNAEREMRPPSGPGRSFEPAVGQRGQWAPSRLEPRSIPGEMTPNRRYTPSPDRARVVVAPNHDGHVGYRSPQPAGVQLGSRQGPGQTHKVWQSSSNSIIFSPSSDAGLSSIPSDSPRGSEGNRSNDDLQTRKGRIRHRPSYKSAVSCDEDEEEEEEEVPVRRGSAGGAWPMSVPLGDMQRAFSSSSPCIIDPPAPPSIVSSSSSSSGRKPPKICIQSVGGEMLPLGQPGRIFESGVGHRGQWIGSPRSVPGESMNTRRSLPSESSPERARVVAPHHIHDLYTERRSSQPECVQPELSQVPDQSQRLRLSSSHSSIFSPSSDTGLSSSDWPPSGPPRGSEWNSSCDDLLARRAGKSGSGPAIQEVLQRAQRTRPESVTHYADINTTAPFHHSMGRLHDDEPRARVLPWHLSTGELYDDQGTESSEDSTSSPQLRQRPAVVRRLSSHLRNRMCRSMGADLDQLLQEEEVRGGAGGNEAARLNRLHLISSSLSLRYNLSSSSLSSCSTPPRCHSLADLVEGVEGKRGRRSSPSVPSSTAQHDGSSRQSVVPLEDKEHAWLVKGAAGAWPDIYSLFREDSSLLNRRDFISGFTVLHWIAKHGDHRVLNTLWYGVQKAGLTFDIDARSTCGHTPLHIAAIHGHKNIMRLLVSKFKANIKLRDTAGKRPWQYLSRNTSADVFQLLDAPPLAAGIEDKTWKPEQQQQHRRRRRHHFSSAGERPLTIAGTAKVKRSSSLAAFLKHKSMRRFHARQSDSSV